MRSSAREATLLLDMNPHLRSVLHMSRDNRLAIPIIVLSVITIALLGFLCVISMPRSQRARSVVLLPSRVIATPLPTSSTVQPARPSAGNTAVQPSNTLSMVPYTQENGNPPRPAYSCDVVGQAAQSPLCIIEDNGNTRVARTAECPYHAQFIGSPVEWSVRGSLDLSAVRFYCRSRRGRTYLGEFRLLAPIRGMLYLPAGTEMCIRGRVGYQTHPRSINVSDATFSIGRCPSDTVDAGSIR